MSNTNLIYARPSDDLAPGATISLVSGSVDPTYNLNDIAGWNPAQGVLFLGTAAQILFDLGSAKAVQFPSLIHTNIRSTATVSIKAKATNTAWGSPTAQQAFTMTDADPDGLRPNPWLNTVAMGAFQYWLIDIASAGITNFFVGGVVLSALFRQLVCNYQEAPKFTPSPQTRALPTNAGVELITSKGVRQWKFDGLIKAGTSASLAELQAWQQDADGHRRPFPVVVDGQSNAAWLARFTKDAQEYTPQYLSEANDIPLSLIEVSRGQKLA